ncbi:ABC transporter ATP-binding protein [Carboxydochorda subterranea]|uniref:ABC transporter ATP-binding protein n=1 Tax=Carboxydichorda subterranea TaxID=3109565 RepID=A0ABZ1BU87_9FIRM|nr:ABC transporter ATP-binding protein [Limnochorda sp. L945t]WRP16244.1 ABC transporter ATP-binding protein [Limnochorda sp. L945t]
MPLLDIQALQLRYTTRRGAIPAVQDVDVALERGESLGIVGESGSGKTSLAISITKMLPDNARITRGHIYLDGTDLVPLSESQMRTIRWRRVSMIFQAAMNSWNPVYTVGDQIVEVIQTHEPHVSRQQARERIAELFHLVGLAPDRMDHYPHEYSGGMKQRAVIAMALSCSPQLVIADEPTTALDVIVQEKILQELDAIRRRLHMTMIYISHDVAVIAEVSDRVAVMYAGRIVELGKASDVFKRPKHPYTAGLMAAFPSIAGAKRDLVTIPGEPPNFLDLPRGCAFHPRCPYATEQCRAEVPPLARAGDDHLAACWHPVAGQDVRADFAARATAAGGERAS